MAVTLFEGLARVYDRALNYVTLFQDRYWKSFLLDEAHVGGEEKVLDLACGTCVLEEYLQSTRCRVVGLDLSERMIRNGQAKNLGRIELLVLGDAESIPMADGAFDVVLSCYLPKYCRTDRLFKEIERVLRPGGRLLVYDFTRPRGIFGPLHALYVYALMRFAGRLARKVAPDLSYTFSELPGIIRRTRWDEEFRRELRGGGFERAGEAVLSGGVVTAFWATKRSHSAGP